ncbi:hypothetical protein BS329_20210 [Amycolatopsis coloradensis]|uniref:PPE family domain-containing protein n=1 Tax=Amycolatopsis coloradensis TaxID=76021 RepID=A0A1R0KS98_9PSEU|nr:hypothetical protein [Amycolatopsis coloradensis]OLZ50725.1 hypothetical protein BS329_20210 [Amycolatopsis coloradensis]
MGGGLEDLFGDARTYTVLSLRAQHDKISAELPHIPRLHAAADMWVEAATWIADKTVSFNQQVENLVSNWPDQAGDTFRALAKRDIDTLRSWVQTPDAQIPVTNEVPLLLPLPSTVQQSRPSYGITMSNVAVRLRELADDIKRTFDYVDTLKRDFDVLFKRPGVQAEDRKAVEDDYRLKAGRALDNLGSHYRDVSDNALPDARGLAWTGPRSDVVPKLTSDSPAGDGANPGGGGDPNATGGDPGTANPGETPKPAETPESPEEQKPLTLQEQLDLASQGLDTAGKAVDLAGKVADQLLGSGSSGAPDVPDPATVPNPLEGWKPGDLPTLSGVPGADNPLGLPSLAGLDGGGGLGGGLGAGGIGAGGAVPSAPGTASPMAGVAGAALPGTAAAMGAAGGTTGGTGGSPGMMPLYPPNGAGGRQGGGDIRPGAAEQVNAVRSRKPDGNPGVALRGRAGAASRPPVTRQRPAVENDVVDVLDEDLWQLNPATDRPTYRTGY